MGVLGPDSLVVEHPLMRAAMLELNTTPPFLLNHSFYTSCTTEMHYRRALMGELYLCWLIIFMQSLLPQDG